MQNYLLAILLIFSGGIFAFLTGRNRLISSLTGAIACIAGSGLALWKALSTLLGGMDSGSFLLNLPLGSATLKLDVVSAFFVLPVVLIGSLSALHFAAVSRHEKLDVGSAWFFFNLLVASMLLLLCSANAVMFLMAWEIMSVAAFFLIIYRDEIATARSAGWRFLVASHIGTAGLFLLFAILASGAGSLEFSQFLSANLNPSMASAIFFLALFGFGVKVGLFPLHVWLPDSYTFADAHVSAILSAAMSKMGFYGLIRVLMFLPVYSESWGWVLLLSGLLTGLFALIIGLAQLDLKRVIAYSSMENAGIILMALGAAVLAVVWQQPLIAFLAFTGALMHIFNHSVCKGLLFFGSGAIFWGMGTRKLELMGGLARKMPFTAVAFGLASAAIAGLPPFNGFVSEFVIFLAGLKSAATGNTPALFLSAILITGLALIGGLAAACFARTFGLVFLGASRHEKNHEPKEVSALVKLPMVLLLIVLLVSPVVAPWFIGSVASVVAGITAPAGMTFASGEEIKYLINSLQMVAGFSFCLLILAVGSWQIRIRFFNRGDVDDRLTWDCGYASPDARMQYTSSSFAQPITEMFSAIVRPFRQGEKVSGLFPEHASFKTESIDSIFRYLFVPLFGLIDRILLPLRAFQHGRLHLYICYIAVTLLSLLIWKVVGI